MSAQQYEIRSVDLQQKGERDALAAFLAAQGLGLDDDLDYALCLTEGERIVASGCAAGKVLKCFAAAPDYRGEALMNRLMSFLRLRAYHEGRQNLFLYTQTEKAPLFSQLGFHILATSSEAVLMESRKEGVQEYLDSLALPSPAARTAALVMNCNPFTLGHRRLIEQASAEQDQVYVFLLREESSAFPFAVRKVLAEAGMADLPRVSLHHGGDYMISRATFPAYFLKESRKIEEHFARIDLDLFSRRIAPALSIGTRYVGEEPYCPLTARYNSLMKEILPSRGIRVREIPRKGGDDGAISASRVRQALAAGRFDRLREWVPPATFAYLRSPEGENIAEILRRKEARSGGSSVGSSIVRQ